MNGERVTLDTNILIYSIDADASGRHDRATQFVDDAVDKNCVLTLQALSEFYWAVTRKGKMSHDDASAQVADWQRLFPTITAQPSTLTMAIQAATRHRLAFWDAMMWATARQNGVDILYSEDFQHGQNIGGVQIKNPFYPAER